MFEVAVLILEYLCLLFPADFAASSDGLRPILILPREGDENRPTVLTDVDGSTSSRTAAADAENAVPIPISFPDITLVVSADPILSLEVVELRTTCIFK